MWEEIVLWLLIKAVTDIAMEAGTGVVVVRDRGKNSAWNRCEPVTASACGPKSRQSQRRATYAARHVINEGRQEMHFIVVQGAKEADGDMIIIGMDPGCGQVPSA